MHGQPPLILCASQTLSRGFLMTRLCRAPPSTIYSSAPSMTCTFLSPNFQPPPLIYVRQHSRHHSSLPSPTICAQSPTCTSLHLLKFPLPLQWVSQTLPQNRGWLPHNTRTPPFQMPTPVHRVPTVHSQLHQSVRQFHYLLRYMHRPSPTTHSTSMTPANLSHTLRQRPTPVANRRDRRTRPPPPH